VGVEPEGEWLEFEFCASLHEFYNVLIH